MVIPWRRRADLLVRAGGWDRALATGELLSRTLDGLPEVGRYRVDLAAGPGRRARTALVGLRFESSRSSGRGTA